MGKIKLTKIDKENWRFVIYRTDSENWIGDFAYSPQSAIDLSMLIKLNSDEKREAQENRENLINLSEKIRNNYKTYSE